MEKKFVDDDEIDLLELFYALKRRWWAILLALIIGGGVAGVYTKKLIAPVYESTSMVYVLSKETTLASLADLQIGSQLTKEQVTQAVTSCGLEANIRGERLGLSEFAALSAEIAALL